MHSETIRIGPKDGTAKAKSRTFSAELVGFLVANPLWDLGGSAKAGTARPVWMAYATSRQQARAFTANLRCGRPAHCEHSSRFLWNRFELPKSAGYRFDTHLRDEACLTVAYLADAFTFSPAQRDSHNLNFLCAPPTWWIEAQVARLSDFGTEARQAALATYFAALLDQRTTLPIAADTRFHLRLFEAACEETWVVRQDDYPQQFDAFGTGQMGLEEPLLCCVSQATFADFLAEQTARHLPKQLSPQQRPQELSRGTTRVSSPRRLLPNSKPSAVQLVLPGFGLPDPLQQASAL